MFFDEKNINFHMAMPNDLFITKQKKPPDKIRGPYGCVSIYILLRVLVCGDAYDQKFRDHQYDRQK